jgi:hypothetical protein
MDLRRTGLIPVPCLTTLPPWRVGVSFAKEIVGTRQSGAGPPKLGVVTSAVEVAEALLDRPRSLHPEPDNASVKATWMRSARSQVAM